jgi:glycerophosphoryl diester phosphodiesterase
MKIYAHRGARTFAPENSMAAFRKALLDFGADGIEIDVHYSLDRELVVMHDFDLGTDNRRGWNDFSCTL